MKKKPKSRTELKFPLVHYASTYGLSLSTVRRNRILLDDPLALLTKLLSSPGPMADIGKLADYINANEQ